MSKDSYIKGVLRKLYCSKKTKEDIKKELSSNIQAALDCGESWEVIEKRMGLPAMVAMEFNENFSKEEKKIAKKNRVFKSLVLGIGLLLVVILAIYWMLPKTTQLDQKGSFNEQTVTKKAQEVITLLNANDYETIKNQYADEKMQGLFTGNTMEEAKKQVSKDWGAFCSFSKAYLAKIEQMGKEIAVIQINVVYEKVSVTFTLSFDKELKLAGLYMK